MSHGGGTTCFTIMWLPSTGLREAGNATGSWTRQEWKMLDGKLNNRSRDVPILSGCTGWVHPILAVSLTEQKGFLVCSTMQNSWACNLLMSHSWYVCSAAA